MRDVRRSGRWFPARGCILEHQICRFAKMILRDRCSTSYDLASIFRGRRSTLDRWSGKNCKTHWYEAVSAALYFPFSRKSRRIALKNCFDFDVVKCKSWGSLAELLRFFFYVVNFERHIIPDRWQSIRSFPLSCQDAVKWGRDSKPIQSLNHLMVSQFSLPSMNHRLTSPIGFLSLKLPPPACAVLLVVDAGSSRLPLGPRRSVASAFWKLRKPSNIHNIPDI